MPTFRVGKPRIRVTLGTTLTGYAGTNAIPWDTVEYEDPAIFDPLFPTRLPITKTGLYSAVFQFSKLVGSATTNFRLDIQKSGVPVARWRIPTNYGGGSSINLQCVWQGEATAGEYLEGVVDAAAGTYDPQATLTWMAMTRIGPERWTG